MKFVPTRTYSTVWGNTTIILWVGLLRKKIDILLLQYKIRQPWCILITGSWKYRSLASTGITFLGKKSY